MIEMKPWYQSKTVWGGLIALSAPLLKFAGVDLAADAQGQLTDALVTLAGAVGGVLAIYGRMSATTAIQGGAGDYR